jgi:hypothetical protein
MEPPRDSTNQVFFASSQPLSLSTPNQLDSASITVPCRRLLPLHTGKNLHLSKPFWALIIFFARCAGQKITLDFLDLPWMTLMILPQQLKTLQWRLHSTAHGATYKIDGNGHAAVM